MNDLSWSRLVQHVHDATWSQLANEWRPLGIVYLCLAVGAVVVHFVMRRYKRNVRGKPERRTQVRDRDV